MSALENLKIASPCPMKWSQLKGDDQVRRCEQCRLDVYNLSKMTEREATQLLTAKKCVTFLRRADGTVITGDCVGGFSRNFWEKFSASRRVGLLSLIVAAASGFLFAALIGLLGDEVRAMFGMSETGLPADTQVVRRARSNGK